MRSKLLIIAALIAAGIGGYCLGCVHTRQAWQENLRRAVENAQHYCNWTRASVNTRVLQHLADGKQVEARELLERQLDIALIAVVAYEKSYNPDARGGIELEVVREARNYRSNYPWASRAAHAEGVRQAFKWAD